MIIEFYKTESENNRLEKVLTDKLAIEGKLKSDIDIINPVLLFKDNVLANYNYCYIPVLNRYYFLDKFEIINNTIHVYLSIDVLMSFKDKIKDLSVVVSASESSPYYNNFQVGYDIRLNKTVLEFENNFNEDGNIILVALYGDRGTSNIESDIENKNTQDLTKFISIPRI